MAVIAAAPPAADAQIDTSVNMYDNLTEGQREQLRQFVRWGGSGTLPPPVNEAPAGYNAAWRAYQAEQQMLLQNASNQLQRGQYAKHNSGMFRLRQVARVLPKLTNLGARALPGVGLALTAITIGGAAAKYFGLGFELDEVHPTEIDPSTVTLQPVPAGSILAAPAGAEVSLLAPTSALTTDGSGWAMQWRYEAPAPPDVWTWAQPGCGEGAWNNKVPERPSRPGQTGDPNGDTMMQTLGATDPDVCGGTYVSFWSPLPGIITTPGMPTADPAVVGPDHAGDQGWQPSPPATDTELDDAIRVHLANDADERQWFATQLDPDNHEDPYSGLVAMPSCIGLSYNACLTALQEAGFGVIERETRTFEEAVPMPEGAADEVLGQLPLAGTMVNPATVATVTIDANPSAAAMPRLVPEPAARETAAQYEARALAPLGLTMNEPVVLSETLLDPLRGPEEVVTTAPAPGSRVPEGEPVTPRVNPPTAPVPGAGGGGCDPWATPSINFGPLQGLAAGNVFPFAAPFWVFAALDSWVGDPEVPEWHFEFPFADQGFDVSLELFDPHMPAIRAVLLVASMLAAAWFFLSLAMGSPSGRSDQS